MGMIVQMMEKLGVKLDINYEQDTITVLGDQQLVVQKTIKGNPRRTHALHRPLLPPDFVHSCVIVALKAE
jgi:hypothetical protein